MRIGPPASGCRRNPLTPPTISSFRKSPGNYFDVLGIPLMAGRNLQPADMANHAIVVNESFARRYFDGANPVGKSIVTGKTTREIVGLVRDAYLTGMDQFVPLFFQPFTGQEAPRLLAREFPGGADAITQIVKGIEPRARIQSVPLNDNLVRILQPLQTMAGVAGALGGFALLLAVIGMSGVFAYVVQQRTKEIGIRMALGAEPKQVIALVLSGTARAALIGLAIGYVAATAVAKTARRLSVWCESVRSARIFRGRGDSGDFGAGCRVFAGSQSDESGSAERVARGVIVAHALLRAVSTLMSTHVLPGASRNPCVRGNNSCRHECRHGTQECVRRSPTANPRDPISPAASRFRRPAAPGCDPRSAARPAYRR